jgi:pyrroline-5-carboxylate reductase
MDKKYIFIGGGNMAFAIIKSMSNINVNFNNNILVVDRNQYKLDYFASLGCSTYLDIADISDIADINKLENVYIFLAIKPQQSKDILSKLAALIPKNVKDIKNVCLISVMAGISTFNIQSYVNMPCIRCMPNMPLIIGKGVTGLYAKDCSVIQKQEIENIFASCGMCYWLENEEQMHAITAISGSGPAYVFQLMHIMQKIAENMGIPKNISLQIIAQTFSGASAMIVGDSDINLQDKINRVASKGGTTQAALNSMYASNISDELSIAINKAYQRSIELELNNIK